MAPVNKGDMATLSCGSKAYLDPGGDNNAIDEFVPGEVIVFLKPTPLLPVALKGSGDKIRDPGLACGDNRAAPGNVLCAVGDEVEMEFNIVSSRFCSISPWFKEASGKFDMISARESNNLINNYLIWSN